MSASVPRTMRSSGQVARATTATGTIFAVARRQLCDHRVDGVNGEVENERRACRRECLQALARRHRRGAARHAGQNDALRDLRHGQLASEQRGGSGKGRNARGQRIRDGVTLEPADLLGDGAEHGQIAGMKSRHVVSGGMGRHILGFDLVERHRRGVDDFRARPDTRPAARAGRSSRHRGRPDNARADRVRGP